MEKLPEKWCIRRTPENAEVINKWFCDNGYGTPYLTDGMIRISQMNGRNYSTDCRECTEITFDQFKRLVLGETEEWEPKAGDWVVITGEGHSKGNHYFPKGEAFQVLCFERTKVDTSVRVVGGSNPKVRGECTNIESVRLARPEEIPQEEVEYVECVKEHTVSGFTNGKIYRLINNKPNPYDSGKENTALEYKSTTWPDTFKPSTREAYEAQQTGKRRTLMDDVNDILSPIEKVNKCSTINTNQNECKNENKSIKVQGSGISISRSSRARGKGLCSSGGKISLGTYYSRNKQKPCSGKA